MSSVQTEFMKFAKIEIYLEALTIASACNKVLRVEFLKPDTTGLIATGGYSSNVNNSNKAVMWLVLGKRRKDVE